MSSAKTFILAAPGTNCERTTKDAIDFVGGQGEIVLIDDWRQGHVRLDDFQAMIVPGGFSYGDHIASGRITGTELRTRFPEEVSRFIEAGKAVVGICNGLQILVEAGLLPYGKAGLEMDTDQDKVLSMTTNAKNHFEWGWSKLLVQDSVCRFIPQGLVGQVIGLPYAHQEGQVATTSPNVVETLRANRQIVFSFVDESGQPTETHPHNPNGSPAGITGICDPSGVVLGHMPHPERAVLTTQVSNWRRHENPEQDVIPHGRLLLAGFVDYANQM